MWYTYKYFYNFEPKDYLTKIKVPTLVLQGGKDHQVFSKENIPRMQEYLSSPFIKEYPNLNHLFQNCETGQPNEYALIEETIDKQVLKDIFNAISLIGSLPQSFPPTASTPPVLSRRSAPFAQRN